MASLDGRSALLNVMLRTRRPKPLARLPPGQLCAGSDLYAVHNLARLAANAIFNKRPLQRCCLGHAATCSLVLKHSYELLWDQDASSNLQA